MFHVLQDNNSAGRDAIVTSKSFQSAFLLFADVRVVQAVQRQLKAVDLNRAVMWPLCQLTALKDGVLRAPRPLHAKEFVTRCDVQMSRFLGLAACRYDFSYKYCMITCFELPDYFAFKRHGRSFNGWHLHRDRVNQYEARFFDLIKISSRSRAAKPCCFSLFCTWIVDHELLVKINSCVRIARMVNGDH